MSFSDKDLIQESLQLFHKGVDSLVPLRHFSQHRDEVNIREAAQKESDKALTHFTRKLKASKVSLSRRGALLNAFCLELDNLTEEYVTNNQDSKKESESFLQSRMEVFCEDFQSSMNAKLLINPDMELKSVEDFFETGKPKASDYFEHLWKHGNVVGFEEQKTKLEEKLDGLKQDMVAKQTRVLQIKEEVGAKKSLEEFQEIVMAVTRQVKYDIVDISILDGKITKDTLKKKAQGLHDSIVNKGKVLKERYEKLYVGLLGVMEDTMKFLDEAVEDMPVEDAVEWADKLNFKLQSRFVKNDEHDLLLRDNALDTPSNELVSTELRAEDESFGEVEAEEMKVSIVAVTSMQLEDNLNEDDGDEINTGMGVVADCGNGVNLEVGRKRSRQEDELEATGTIVTPSISKRLRKRSPNDSQKRERTVSNASDKSGGSETETTMHSTNCDDNNVNPWNVSDKDGDFPLLLAIYGGERECIEKMLDSGADVNVKGRTRFSRLEINAAHAVIDSLILKRLNPFDALAILNRLVAEGFNLINDRDSHGFTPLHFAMQYENLNEDILRWFCDNGADFNAVVENTGNSVIFEAIIHGRAEGIIQKIIDFGGNQKHVDKWKMNVLHKSAMFANESALQYFIDKMNVNVNEQDENGESALHLLFCGKGSDHHRSGLCLEMLLKKDADFTTINAEGLVPLLNWIKGGGNPFPTLIKMKDTLPITEEMASATLTAIVQQVEMNLDWLPSSSKSPPNEFVKFGLFLIEEKRAKLLWKEENRPDWQNVDPGIFTRNFFREPKSNDHVNFEGELVRVTSKNLGELELHTESSTVSFTIETIIAWWLTCKNYQGFVELCRIVGNLCEWI